MAGKRRNFSPQMNIKEEAVNLWEYRNYREAYERIGEFLDNVYMHKRIHSALGYLTPVEFET